jgi:hypothetical protein
MNAEPTAAPTRSSNAKVLKQVRQLHLYLGVFFAPAIIFFSLTGALQLFGLHEGHPGEAYQPPKWIAALSSIHKDQVLSQHHGPLDQRDAGPPGPDQKKAPGRPPEPRGEDEHHEGKATLILKCFFLAMSIGLLGSTLLGIYMAFKFNRSRALIWGLLIAGAGIPTALIALLA